MAAGYRYMECVVLALDAASWQQSARSDPETGARAFAPGDGDDWLTPELDERDPGHPAERYLPYLLS